MMLTKYMAFPMKPDVCNELHRITVIHCTHIQKVISPFLHSRHRSPKTVNNVVYS